MNLSSTYFRFATLWGWARQELPVTVKARVKKRLDAVVGVV